MVQMYFDPNAGGYGQPSQHNPWFNGQSPHGYSVGYDFNHESGHTRQFFKDVFQYWLTEFKVDGFRIDLSKGLTQKYSGGDIGVWNAYDQSRINILNDYKSHIKWVNPNAYVILEHFADNSEETVLANSGMMLWSAMHNNYKQVAMGWENSSNVSWAFHGNRGWNYPNLVDYMETHDEERMMTEALTNGNSSIYYNVRDFNSALHHQEQGLVLCLGIPGPKMLYQFQEMGYDYSVTYGGGRTSPKPPRWDYLDVAGRERLNRVVSGMAALRKSDAFRYGSFTSDLGGLGKRIWIAHSSMDVVISVNMGVYGFDMAPGFTKSGTWYDYFTGESFYVSDPGGHFFFFGPGDYRVFTSQPRPKPFHNLQVTVLDSETNAPINLATLHLSNAGNRTTDTNGLAGFLALPQAVSVTAQKFGYITQTKDTVISNNTNLTIKMVPGWDPASGWANLKWPGTGVIMEGQDYTVYAQAWINGITGLPVPNPGLEAWIGYSSTNTDPSTWTTWVPATYDTAIGNNNQYLANIGGATSQPGTWYYASRFRMDNGCFVYGGYSGSNGGFWNGVSNVSGVLTVNALPSVIDWVNLQWPASGSIEPGGNFMVYSRVYIAGTTSQTLPVSGLNAWIGYSTTNTNPATWTNWIPANYSTAVGNNDEYSLNLGAQITTGGTYYYASRFRYNNGSYYYGGYAASGGGFWNGGNYISGILNVLPSYKQVDLTVFLEGLYAGSRTMYKSQNETGDNFTGTVADKITVELHDNANYGSILHTAADIDLHTNGSATISIPYTFAGSYYLTVKHRNSIETTTAAALSFAGTTIACDFSSSADQAFGSNMKNLGEGVFGIYGGDANADGSVDALDLIIVDNDASSFASGYLPADVNGDGAVDALDLILTDNNSSAFVAVILPW
jgi:hypothetical protein